MATGQDVADYLGRGDDTALVAMADTHVGHVTNLARAYTRGQGFDTETGEPEPDVDSVIVGATARIVVNPEGLRSKGIGSLQVSYGFTGWTLPERLVLNGYRRRLA